MIPKWFEETLPCRVDGVMPYEYVGPVLGSQLARTFNIKYLLVAPDDATGMAAVRALPAYKEIKRLPRTVVFANEDALPRAYFATHAYPYQVERFQLGMIQNKAPLRSAFIANWPGPPRLFPEAKVLRAEFGHRGVDVEIDAPGGGFLVVSASYYPDWGARIDGKPASVSMVNGRVLGLEVPAGAKRVVFEYAPESLTAGLALGAVGALLLAGIIVWTRRKLSTISDATSSGLLARDSTCPV